MPMVENLPMRSVRKDIFDDLEYSDTSSDSGIIDSQSRSCGCRRSCRTTMYCTLFITIIICIIFVSLYICIAYVIIPIKNTSNQITITTPTTNLSTILTTSETSLPPSVTLTLSTSTNEHSSSSSFGFTSTADLISGSTISTTTKEIMTTETTTNVAPTTSTTPTTPTTTATRTTTTTTTTTATPTTTATRTTTTTTTTTATPTTTATRTTTTTSTTTTTLTTTTTPTTTTTLTTTTTIPPELCPPILLNPIQINNLLTLDNITRSSNYTHYVLQFETPSEATIALLVFEFQTQHESWYLDDVSVKRSDGLGSEIIQNGGFENGIFNLIWKYCYPMIPSLSALISRQLCRSGRYCFASRGFDDHNEYLTQKFNIQSNIQYTIEFYTFCNGEPDLFAATISFQ